MQKGWLYIKDSGDFRKKTWNLGSIPENTILVMTDVVDLYPSIPHEAGLKALREVLDNREEHTVPTSKLTKMTDFVLKNNYFEFNKQIKQKISGTAIGTKFVPPYACLFMDTIETTFLQTQELQPLVWFRYIDDIFFMWTDIEQEIQTFLHSLNSSIPTSSLLISQAKKALHFLTLKLVLKTVRLLQICI